jgi:hypothetical protein
MFFVCLIAITILFFGCNKEDVGLGTIQGSMIVSEDCAQNKCPIADYSDIYASRKLAIYTIENNTLIAYLKISENGTYTYKLLPGDYAINLINDHYDITYDMPKDFKIEANKTSIIDVNIVIERNEHSSN